MYVERDAAECALILAGDVLLHLPFFRDHRFFMLIFISTLRGWDKFRIPCPAMCSALTSAQCSNFTGMRPVFGDILINFGVVHGK